MSRTRYLCKECGQHFWEDGPQEDDDHEGVCGPCGQRIFREGYFGKPQRRFFYVLVALMLLAEWYFFDLRNLKTGLAALFGW